MPEGTVFEFVKELINNGLFPIVAYFLMVIENRRQREAIESFKSSMSETMTEQTKALTILSERVESLTK